MMARCAPQPLSRKRRLGGYVVLEFRHAPRRRQAGQVERLLDGHRDAVEWAELPALCHLLVPLPCEAAGLLETLHHDSVDAPVQALDPVQMEIKELEAADLALAHELREVDRRAEGKSVVHWQVLGADAEL